MAIGFLVAAPISGDQSAAVAWGRGGKGITLPLLVREWGRTEVHRGQSCVTDAWDEGWVMWGVWCRAWTFIHIMLPVSFGGIAEGAMSAFSPAEVGTEGGVDRVGLDRVQVSLLLIIQVCTDVGRGVEVTPVLEASVVLPVGGKSAD